MTERFNLSELELIRKAVENYRSEMFLTRCRRLKVEPSKLQNAMLSERNEFVPEGVAGRILDKIQGIKDEFAKEMMKG